MGQRFKCFILPIRDQQAKTNRHAYSLAAPKTWKDWSARGLHDLADGWWYSQTRLADMASTVGGEDDAWLKDRRQCIIMLLALRENMSVMMEAHYWHEPAAIPPCVCLHRPRGATADYEDQVNGLSSLLRNWTGDRIPEFAIKILVSIHV